MNNRLTIVTTVSAWPEALEAQRFLLDKYCETDFKFVAVIDTSPNPNAWNLWDSSLREKAMELSTKYCDEVLLVPEELHSERKKLFPKTQVKKAKYSNERAADALQFVFTEKILKENFPTLILDSDMFPFAPFNSINNLLHKAFRGVYQVRTKRFKTDVEYFWNGIMEFDPSKLPNLDLFSFDCGKVNGIKVDTGGQSYRWLEMMKENQLLDSIGEIHHLSSLNWELPDYLGSLPIGIRDYLCKDTRNEGAKVYAEIYDNTFLHFRAGSNWKEEAPELVKIRHLEFIQACFK